MYYQSQPIYRKQSTEESLWVTGTGIVEIQPDIAFLRLGAVTEDKSLAVAQQRNAETIGAVTRSLVTAGIAERHIQTAEYFIYPEYDYEDGKQKFRGYRVTHLLKVKVEKIEDVGAVIDLAVSQGANRVSDIQFDVRNKSEIEQEALQRSIEDAKKKAQTIARTIQVQLHPTPLKIVESGAESIEMPISYGKSVVASSSSTPVQPGETKITSTIQAKFSYSSI
ncbi:SIMPL domain-containing protein [Halobacillus locisalis]|uniref:SIMPL domain-containing protein n=1 Tax=Halobacillus locisalis TaxID=220753 RepID=A0A838CQM4_9BACI|nr:SIMPL domain-containing protein [Halobacillus locisalis]MBA2174422.1 SIMPL domain-containing protein [Halobacillus locisalis]